MAETGTTVGEVSMCIAENGGYIVRYSIYGKPNEKDTYGSRSYLGEKKEVFGEGEGTEALARMQELAGMEPDLGAAAPDKKEVKEA